MFLDIEWFLLEKGVKAELVSVVYDLSDTRPTFPTARVKKWGSCTKELIDFLLHGVLILKIPNLF